VRDVSRFADSSGSFRASVPSDVRGMQMRPFNAPRPPSTEVRHRNLRFRAETNRESVMERAREAFSAPPRYPMTSERAIRPRGSLRGGGGRESECFFPRDWGIGA